MTRIYTLLISLALLLSLCACGASPDGQEMPKVPDDLTPLLESLSEHVHPATAGSSLAAAQEACLLLDWSCTTEMDDAAIRSAVGAFLEGRSEEEQELFSEQVLAVLGAADSLMQEEGAGLLEDIGGPDGTLWPWTDAPLEKLDAIRGAIRT